VGTGSTRGEAPWLARRGARDAGWTYRQFNTPHDPQLFDAEGIAQLMIELAS
jgi:hypothetical protein